MQTHCPAASRFTILDELRSHFPAVQSLLTDQATALSARALWTEEVMPLKRDLARLTLDEEALYKNVRLEQERIPFQQVAMALYWRPGIEKAFTLRPSQ